MYSPRLDDALPNMPAALSALPPFFDNSCDAQCAALTMQIVKLHG
jgi:hypothetical protein